MSEGFLTWKIREYPKAESGLLLRLLFEGKNLSIIFSFVKYFPVMFVFNNREHKKWIHYIDINIFKI